MLVFPYKWKCSGILKRSDESRTMLHKFDRNGWKSKNLTSLSLVASVWIILKNILWLLHSLETTLIHLLHGSDKEAEAKWFSKLEVVNQYRADVTLTNEFNYSVICIIHDNLDFPRKSIKQFDFYFYIFLTYLYTILVDSSVLIKVL